MKTIHSNASLNSIIIYSLGALIHAFTIQSEEPRLRKHKIYVSSSSIKWAFSIEMTTADGRDHWWQIHLLAELVLPVDKAFALTISPSTVTILLCSQRIPSSLVIYNEEFQGYLLILNLFRTASFGKVITCKQVWLRSTYIFVVNRNSHDLF
jgi:hypothetical protein